MSRQSPRPFPKPDRDLERGGGLCTPPCAICPRANGSALSQLKAGGFVILDAETFEVKGSWERPGDAAPQGYNFWYQPRHNVMLSSEWGVPKYFVNGFNVEDLGKERYGCRINVLDWTTHCLLKSIYVGQDSSPFEVRFLHNPDAAHCLVGCILQSSIEHVFKDEGGCWVAKKVIQVLNKKV